MKKINQIVILLLSFLSFSQNNLDHKKVGDTIFYNKKYSHVNKESAFRFATIKKIEVVNNKKSYALDIYKIDSTNNSIAYKETTTNTQRLEIISFKGLTTNYYKNGIVRSKGMTKDNRKIGEWIYWYDNGNIKMERLFFERKTLEKFKPSKLLNYWKIDSTQTVINGNGEYDYTTEKDSTLHKGNVKNGKKDGVWIGRYKDGNKYYDENYIEGELISGESWDKDGNNYQYKKEFEQPEFKGGQSKMRKIIQRNFKVPKVAFDNNIDGTILIRFYVNIDGSITDVKAYRKVLPESDREAIRVVKLMKGWKPAIKKGKKVRSRFVLPITYKIQ